jgi:3-dehydroquinate dehydratase type I
MGGMSRARTRFGNVILGTASRIVGVISQGETLQRLATGGERECDIIELRLDLVGPDTPRWLEDAQAIEARGLPIIVTIRLSEEGGQWKRADEARLPLFEKALSHLAAVDIELRSPLVERVSALARQHQRALIVSHHDFEKTASLDELRAIMTRAAKYGTVAKIAVSTRSEQDIATLRALLHEECPVPLCLLGMGPLGAQTRVEFPKLGSCLTYGYLDAPVASGQISAGELTKLLGRK